MLETLLIYLAVGAIAGFIAGLFGVGGGLIIVPVLVYLFSQQGMHSEYLVHMAVGTSLATIIFTSISSVRAHHRRGAVLWPVVWRLATGIVVGALLGAAIADWMSSLVLRRFFAVFEWLVALQLLFGVKPPPARNLPASPGLFGVGNVIGAISAIVGIGGGTLTVPYLVWNNIDMRKAVATSSACGLPIAIAGATGFVLTGLRQAGLPDWSIGYLYLPALAGIVIASVLFAPLGARVAHWLDPARLKRLFGIFLLMLGTYMFLRQ